MWAGWQLAGAGEWSSTWRRQRALVGRFDRDDQIGAVCYHHICHLYNTFTTEYMHYNYISKNSAQQADSHCILSSSSSFFMKHKYSFPVAFSAFGMWRWVSGLAHFTTFQMKFGENSSWTPWRNDTASQPGMPPSEQGKSMTQWHSVTSRYTRTIKMTGKASGLTCITTITRTNCWSLSWARQIHPQFTTHLMPTFRSLKYLFPSALYPPLCMYLSPRQVFHALPTPLSLNQSMKTTKHEDPYHMSQFKSFHLFSPFTNVYPVANPSYNWLVLQYRYIIYLVLTVCQNFVFQTSLSSVL